MSDFFQGQRWVIDSEPELGLGTVTRVEGRTVGIHFPLADCERTYAIGQAPLTRIFYSAEDSITKKDGGTATVAEVHEKNGLYFYATTDGEIVPETELSPAVQLNQPFMRLMTGQLDQPNWFFFKRQLSDAISRVWRSRLNGLLGVRANLIPHQLYVAWRACEAEHVRVLLSDEVGLGKTLEAGMILSRLLKLERAQRALIVVPPALQVQWLVELVRRFSLHADIYKGAEHDFASGTIHIVPHSAIVRHAEAIDAAHFDLCIVDEAHHLVPESEAFASLRNITTQARHAVLLTATPEQLGMRSHFARLQLLDAEKFSDYETFVQREHDYVVLSNAIKALPEGRDSLIKDYKLDVPADASNDSIISQLLDRHGVGRVVYRNVRSSIQGFPRRVANVHLLPEASWEARFDWLGQWLKKHFNEKVLVICHDIDHVFACEDYLWKKFGMDAATFHEQQDLVERDRAAAYFADTEKGAQMLVCSEIGSEGRNFQFCSHLVCLDLPEHPDLLEQRIGRLDRIGQKHDVNIHLPFAEGSEEHYRFRWFHETLECVEQQNPAAPAVHDEYWPQLQHNNSDAAIIGKAKKALVALREEIRQGRDALLEMNSCRQPMANQLRQTIEEFEAQTPLALVEAASELLQFYFEETRQGCYSLIPSDTMLISALPGIPPEGIEITFDRNIANQREEVLYLSWDAPFIQGLWELLHYSELGSASVATLPSQQLPAGHCLLEACFDLVSQSEISAECRPFLEALTVRSIAIDISDKDLGQALPEAALQSSLQNVKKHVAREIVKSKKNEIPAWYKKCENFAERQKQHIIENAVAHVQRHFKNEIDRLKQLGKLGEDDQHSTITHLQAKQKRLIEVLTEQTHLHLAATRLIVVTGK